MQRLNLAGAFVLFMWIIMLIMDSMDNQYERNQTDSECPECKKKYSSSVSHSGSSSEERIVIPLRRELLNNSNAQIEAILKNLQGQVDTLKKSNQEKDRTIDELRRQIDHKMTHYMLKGEISKQSEQIQRLRSELNQNSYSFHAKQSDLTAEEIRNIVRQETKRAVTHRSHSERILPAAAQSKQLASKSNLSKLRRQFITAKPKRHTSPEYLRDDASESNEVFNQYFETAHKKGVFRVGEAKRRLAELENKLKRYEEEVLWMRNFVTAFVRTMQAIAYKKYQQQIIIPEWSLKKKAKTSWRYMKHVFKFLYDAAD